MMDFALKNNDLKISDGDITLCDNDVHATAQSLTIRLKLLAGEWFIDQNIGLPYFTEILSKKRSVRFLEHLVRNEVKDVAGLSDIKSFSITDHPSARSVTIKFTAILSDRSELTINELIGV